MQILTSNAANKPGFTDDSISICSRCEVKPAEIFQINGEYCLDCWQNITHTDL